MKVIAAIGLTADPRMAHVTNTIGMANGFARLGHEVTLVCRQAPAGSISPAQLRKDFGFTPSLAAVQVKDRMLGRPLDEHIHFGLQVAAAARSLKPDFSYCRNYIAPAMLSAIGVPAVAESQTPRTVASRGVRAMLYALRNLSKFRALVTAAPIVKDNFVRLGAPEHKVHVLPNAVDLGLFRRPEGFRRVGAGSRPVIVYTGNLYDTKGIPAILGAAARLPGCDFVLVGGKDDDIALQAARIAEQRLGNVTLKGVVPQSEVPQYLWNADVLLLPPSAERQPCGPSKLAEYLASGTPVVATRIPAMEEVVTGDQVVFVPPDDPATLADGIERLLSDPAYAADLARRALLFAETLSYENRCRKVLDLAGL